MWKISECIGGNELFTYLFDHLWSIIELDESSEEAKIDKYVKIESIIYNLQNCSSKLTSA